MLLVGSAGRGAYGRADALSRAVLTLLAFRRRAVVLHQYGVSMSLPNTRSTASRYVLLPSVMSCTRSTEPLGNVAHEDVGLIGATATAMP